MSAKFAIRGLRTCLILCFVVIGAGDAYSQGDDPGTTSIEGTWKLVSRDLADGSKQTQPDIMGLLTFQDGYRNLNVYWTDADGTPCSLSMISTYELGDKEYSETCTYRLLNDEISGKGAEYDISGVVGTSPVSKKGERIEIDLPLFDEPTLVFEGDKLTATREGEFVDHWVRVG